MMATSRSPFLAIPPELRLQIYTYLLVSHISIKGPHARQFQSERYNIQTAILRTNKQIYSEARHVFFSHNTFCINSLPGPGDDEEGSGAFEPPLQWKDLSLVRHLELDLLYWPRVLRTVEGWGWEPICPSAGRYVMNLSFLLSAVKKSLVELKVVTDTRPYARGMVGEEEDRKDGEQTLDVQKMLTGFHVADTSSRFRNALANLQVKEFSMRFSFPDSYFDFKMVKEALLKGSMVHLVGQVLMARCEVRMNAALEELEEKSEDERMEE